MVQKKHNHIPASHWNTFLDEFLEDIPENIRSDLAKIVTETHLISEEKNYMPNVLLPVIRGIYRRNESKRKYIKSSLSKIIDEIVKDKLYEEILIYDATHGSLKPRPGDSVDTTAELMTLLALDIAARI